MRKKIIICFAALPLASCATAEIPLVRDNPAGQSAATQERAPEGRCNAEPVQYHVGHTVSQAMGQAMLAESGATRLRWAPPRTAMTMDYLPFRLTVHYDDDMVITQVTCG